MKEEVHEEKQVEENVAAVLDVRSLVQRCVQLEKELALQMKRNQEQEACVADFDREYGRMKAFVKAGQAAVRQKQEEISAMVRTIAHATGNPERVRKMEALFAGKSLEPEDTERWHATLARELEALYPTAPCSKPPESAWKPQPSEQMAAFQFPKQ